MVKLWFITAIRFLKHLVRFLYALQLCTRMVELMDVRMVMMICTNLFNVSFFIISYILLLPSSIIH